VNSPVGAPGVGQKPKLLDQVRAALRTRHYSYRTEEAYIHWLWVVSDGGRRMDIWSTKC